MAVRSRGQKKEYVDEIKQGGVATQVELGQAINDHLTTYDHTVLGEVNLPATTESNQIINSVPDGLGGFKWDVRDGSDLLNGISLLAEPYYYDDIRNKYLTNNTTVVPFYKDGTNIKNQYLYQTPGIVSSALGYKVFGDYCIVGYEFYATSTVSGDIVEVSDTSTGTSILDIVLPSSSDQLYEATADVTVSNVELAAYVGNVGIDTPTVKVYLKQIIIP